MAGVTRSAWWQEAWVQAMNRLAARRAARAEPAAGFVSQPEPRTIGLFARGKQLVAGNFLFAGHLVEAPGIGIWDITRPSPTFEAELQGFAWLDDLAAVGDPVSRKRAQDWTFDWINRYGKGQGMGWSPDLTGRRLIRWINHAILLLTGQDRQRALAYYHSLSQQTLFLSRRWQAASPGLPRFEALTGLIYAGLALIGMENHVDPAAAALARECEREVDAQGGIPTRNPEELLEVFTLLTWAAQALSDAGRIVPAAHLAAIARIAPTLRALRHADGGLARFHGGGRGLEGRLDHALANSGVKPAPHPGPAMGFIRLSGGRSSVIIDATSPPQGLAGASAHASTLAFELTSGRRPVVVNCGSGAPFGADWHRASRATQSHSTLAVDGYSSSRFARDGREVLVDLAGITVLDPTGTEDGPHLLAGHDGWRGTHGLTHLRDLTLSHDGRHLNGVDMLTADTASDRARLGTLLGRQKDGIGFSLRFHLHPDTDAALDMGGTAVSIALRSGEIWVFRHDGQAKLTLEPSVYLEKGRLMPRATKQILLTANLRDFEGRIGWTLAKAQDTPLAIRDLDREDAASRP
ncbi:heparinase II/III family protein [Gemmobacter serpentinus]|uniref:heparinase II/III family protein n=1 Tax=Gemmobacter serpentinus TaxID=2652247 RepID=UPI001CF6CCAA|nr:heparinase II/III family protein [Gemmobacter serpentinus]